MPKPKRKRTKPGAARTAAREGGTKYPLLGPTTTSKVPKITTSVGKPTGKGKTMVAKGAWGLAVGTYVKYPRYTPKSQKVSTSTTSSIGKKSKVPPKYKGR